MVVSKRDAARSTLIGFLLGALLAFPLWFSDKLLEQVPYTDAVVTRFEKKKGHMIIGGRFNKTTSCKVEDVFVLAGADGDWYFLKFKPIDGSTQIRNRPAGENTYLWEVDYPKDKTLNISVIEIRTSHICSGNRVDKVLANIPYE